LAGQEIALQTNFTIPLLLTVTDIRNERFIELAFEGHRMHDLRRLRLSTGSFAWNVISWYFLFRKEKQVPAREYW